MAGSGPSRGVLFVATTGHEIGLPGIEAFLGARPAVLTGARLWVHFGANLGATPHVGPRYAATDEELRSGQGGPRRGRCRVCRTLRPDGGRGVQPHSRQRR